MASKKTVVIVLSVIFCVLVGMFVIFQFSGKVASNPPGTYGNTAGNLYNGGYFCENDGRVYFGNAYDEGTLYSMKPDETDLKKLSTAKIGFINAAGDYLYYYQKDSSAASSLGFVVHMSGLYRCNKNGDRVVCLDKSDCNTALLIDNTIYYEKAEKGANTTRCLYQVFTDKSNNVKLSDECITPASAQGNGFYYNNVTANHHLMYLDIHTNQSTEIYPYDMWFPTIHTDGNIYFLDLKNDYALCSYNPISQETKTLTTDRVDFFNLSQNYIYYQKNSAQDPALMRMRLDGSDSEIIQSGNFSDLSITSEYVYFKAFGTDLPVYHTPAEGAVNVSQFEAAKEAAYKNLK